MDITPTAPDGARREYADWYVREQVARREAKKWRDGRATLAEAEMLGWAKPVFEIFRNAGIEPAETIEHGCAVGDWLIAEAEYRRMHAEAVLRSYGAPVLSNAD